MIVEIHLFMKDADNQNGVTDHAKKNDVQAGSHTAISLRLA